MQYEISDLKAGQVIMQEEIRSIKRGQTVIIRAATQNEKRNNWLKRENKTFKMKRIDAVLMDVETVNEKTEQLKMVR